MTAHPRLRGDHRTPDLLIANDKGSSPPARGPQWYALLWSFLTGLIPACAGTTWGAQRPAQFDRAHPRLRGDHTHSHGGGSGDEGSSPPARGPRFERGYALIGLRLIPACAGTTRARSRSFRWARAHPRLRGDHCRSRCCCLPGWGSSPPARGPHRVPVHRPWRTGLIPACAGTTAERFFIHAACPAHPRLRGDHAVMMPFSPRQLGSSPPARGPPGCVF